MTFHLHDAQGRPKGTRLARFAAQNVPARIRWRLADGLPDLYGPINRRMYLMMRALQKSAFSRIFPLTIFAHMLISPE
jgi:predicted DCC family thiol-disulfide oxidoreductase YuxK